MKYKFLSIGILVFIVALLPMACGPAQYTLNTLVSPEGTGTITPDGGTYDAGTEVRLVAEPVSGYAFDQWSGDVAGITNSVTITMDSDKSVSAHFKAQYALNTSVSPSGGGVVSPASGAYDAGTEVTLTATPAKGFAFDRWGGDASGISSPVTTITMNGTKSVTAYFRAVFVSDDGRIGFALDKIERTQSWHGDTTGAALRYGNNYVIVYVKIVFIQEGHFRLSKSILADTSGFTYDYIGWVFLRGASNLMTRAMH